jgi:hypothetical protein
METHVPWADFSYSVARGETVLLELFSTQMSLIAGDTYIAAVVYPPLTAADLRFCRQALRMEFAGKTLFALIDPENKKAQRFATFFGLRHEDKTASGELYYEGLI